MYEAYDRDVLLSFLVACETISRGGVFSPLSPSVSPYKWNYFNWRFVVVFLSFFCFFLVCRTGDIEESRVDRNRCDCGESAGLPEHVGDAAVG